MPFVLLVNEMVELLDDAVDHNQHVLGVPGAQRNQDDRKHFAHGCFLLRLGC